jgi:hypothetical protein
VSSLGGLKLNVIVPVMLVEFILTAGHSLRLAPSA